MSLPLEWLIEHEWKKKSSAFDASVQLVYFNIVNYRVTLKHCALCFRSLIILLLNTLC